MRKKAIAVIVVLALAIAAFLAVPFMVTKAADDDGQDRVRVFDPDVVIANAGKAVTKKVATKAKLVTAISEINAAPGHYIISLTDDIDIASAKASALTISGAKNVVELVGNGYEICYSDPSAQGCLAAASGATLIVGGSGGEISICGDEDSTKRPLLRADNACLAVREGASLSEKNTSSPGAGIELCASKFSMDGGSISACRTTSSGGAIYVGSSSDAEVIGGEIDDCSAEVLGGLAQVDSGCSLYIGGSCVITSCSSSTGGAVSVSEGAKFSISGDSSISDCSASSCGGAIYSLGQTSIGGDVVIDDCTSQFGGAVYAGGGELSVSGDSFVSGSEAGYCGGGIYIDSASCSLSGNASVDNDSAATYGGGVYVERGTLSMSDAAFVAECKAYIGGGIFNNQGKVDAKAVYGSSADALGDDIYNSRGTLRVRPASTWTASEDFRVEGWYYDGVRHVGDSVENSRWQAEDEDGDADALYIEKYPYIDEESGEECALKAAWGEVDERIVTVKWVNDDNKLLHKIEGVSIRQIPDPDDYEDITGRDLPTSSDSSKGDFDEWVESRDKDGNVTFKATYEPGSGKKSPDKTGTDKVPGKKPAGADSDGTKDGQESLNAPEQENFSQLSGPDAPDAPQVPQADGLAMTGDGDSAQDGDGATPHDAEGDGVFGGTHKSIWDLQVPKTSGNSTDEATMARRLGAGLAALGLYTALVVAVTSRVVSRRKK